jgi:hypothetical protein
MERRQRERERGELLYTALTYPISIDVAAFEMRCRLTCTEYRQCHLQSREEEKREKRGDGEGRQDPNLQSYTHSIPSLEVP